jgi:peptidoglycan/LPS O-acetylase OafA/YrhL
MAATGLFGGGPLAVTWSLAVEEQFYLTLPLLVRKLSRRRLGYVAVGIVAGAALLRAIVIYLYPVKGLLACYVLMPCRADALGLGVVSALLVRNPEGWNFITSHRRLLYACFGVFLSAVVYTSIKLDAGTTSTVYGLIYSLLAMFYTSALLLAVSGEDTFVRIFLCNRPIMALGSIAYGTYMLNLFCLNLLHLALLSSNVTLNTANTLGTTVASLLVTIGLAALSWRFFEKPLVRRGHAFTY